MIQAEGGKKVPRCYDYTTLTLLTNTKLPPALHRFRDISLAFDRSKNRYIRLPILRLTARTEGLPWDDLSKIFRGCYRMANIAENFNWLSRLHEHYRHDRQTGGRQHIANNRLPFVVAAVGEINGTIAYDTIHLITL